MKSAFAQMWQFRFRPHRLTGLNHTPCDSRAPKSQPRMSRVVVQLFNGVAGACRCTQWTFYLHVISSTQMHLEFSWAKLLQRAIEMQLNRNFYHTYFSSRDKFVAFFCDARIWMMISPVSLANTPGRLRCALLTCWEVCAFQCTWLMIQWICRETNVDYLPARRMEKCEAH